MKNSKAWIIWLISSITILLTNRNPIYLIIILIGLLILGNRLSTKEQQPSWLQNNIRFLGTMIFLSSLINALFTHRGSSVIFKLPESWLLIGGKITLESLVFGIINGLVIGSLYIAFNIFNLALNTKQITRLIPKLFHPIAITISIALTFFPSIQQRARDIKEAQLIRGNQMKHIVDWLPVFLPLLISSLENAFLLSESMTARGYQSHTKSFSRIQVTYPIIISTFLIFSGWILQLYDYPDLISYTSYIIGMAIFLVTMYISNKNIKVTHYHQEPFNKKDLALSAILILTLLIWVMLQVFGDLSSASYSPYPKMTLPVVQFSAITINFSMIFPLLTQDK